MGNSALARNSPRIIADTIDGEVIMIDLQTGSYYSLNGTAAEIWELFEAPRSTSQIVDALVARYTGVDRAIVRDAVQRFVETLSEAQLLVHSDTTPAELTAPSPHGSAPDFRPPTLTGYDDMQDLLLLDPIHEVDEGGWPRRRTSE